MKKMIVLSMMMVMLLAIVAYGYSTSNGPGSTITASSSASTTTDNIGIVTDWSFPLEDDVKALSETQGHSYSMFRKTSLAYLKTYDHFPESFGTLVDSGYMLFWPRNLSSGKPIQVLNNSDNITADEQHFGMVGYKRLSETTVKFNYVYYGSSKSDKTDAWRIRTFATPIGHDLALPEFIFFQKNIIDIRNTDERVLLGMFGQLTDILATESDRFYVDNKVMPSLFTDVLGPKHLVISENFDNFVKLVDKSKVKFKWGMDNESYYIYLKINGHEYIKNCIYHGGGSGMADMVSMFSCEYDNLDTSNPILTENNLKDMIIPENYLVSKDIIPIIE